MVERALFRSPNLLFGLHVTPIVNRFAKHYKQKPCIFGACVATIILGI